MANFDSALVAPSTVSSQLGSREYAMQPAELALGGDLLGGQTIYSKRGVYVVGGVRTRVVHWTGTDPTVLDGSDQSEVDAGDLVEIGVTGVTVT